MGVLVAVLAFIGFFNIKAYLHYWINETVSDKLGDYIEKNPEKITQFIKNNKDVSDFFTTLANTRYTELHENKQLQKKSDTKE